MKLTILDPQKDIIKRDRDGNLTGKMADHFRFFLRLVYSLLENTDSQTFTLADEQEFGLDDSSSGMGEVIIGDNLAYAIFTWTTDAVVTIEDSKGSVVNTDTDTNLCIYDDGTQVKIKNRLGDDYNIRYIIKYNPQ